MLKKALLPLLAGLALAAAVYMAPAAAPAAAATAGARTAQTVTAAVYSPAQPAGIAVFVNSKKLTFDVPPVVENGRTLVPLRAIFEALGAQVGWDGKTGTVTAKRGEVTVKLTLKQIKAYRNGKAVTLEVPARLVKGRTMVPLRFVSEAFGAQVNWNAKTRAITVGLK
ncbi:copper amine oxidase N-terminal domain-containing protein [Desulfotomaculum copahuensis]|uniref:copper amine oxidase N-terminal domain-containing protein n=1 Tax=Desulfotomaculum copahuensis TaxID=1838280 RepID=UPI000ACD8446|nr:copper amine oxidase N-terminal domain-containing protein [Desulfotomaculum copahuensis]